MKRADRQMLLNQPSDEDLRHTFERVLAGILSGEYLSAPDGNGLDEQTNAALDDLVGERNAVATKTLAARAEFMRQISGEHSASDEQDMLNALNSGVL